eukprot:3418950-Amphidinium_carterae.1
MSVAILAQASSDQVTAHRRPVSIVQEPREMSNVVLELVIGAVASAAAICAGVLVARYGPRAKSSELRTLLYLIEGGVMAWVQIDVADDTGHGYNPFRGWKKMQINSGFQYAL